MAKSKARGSLSQVEELQAKVLRRSEKLIKSLRLLVAQTEPGRSPAQKLLKALESALPHLQQFTEASHEDGSKATSKRTKKVKETDVLRPDRNKQAAKKTSGKASVTAPEGSPT